MSAKPQAPLIAVACGGTGGHLFPGVAVAHVLQAWGCDIALLVSKKEVDQEAVKAAACAQVVPLPAVALQNRQWKGFVWGSWESFWLCRAFFRQHTPRAVLAMGGFTSAPPILAGKACGAAAFLHESNSIPGRANRWLAPWVDEVFVGFPEAAHRLASQNIRFTGTPVRPQFKPAPGPESCRMAMGLQPNQPVLLVMGGSQGASGINQLLEGALPELASQAPDLQFLHLTGPSGFQQVQAVYARYGRRAAVRPFLTEMDLALGAATLVVNRAGASSIAELAALKVPAILIPYPYATDNHQFFNARALARVGAALLLEQRATTSSHLASAILDLLRNDAAREKMRAALRQWQFPGAAAEIAGHIFTRIGLPRPKIAPEDDDFQPSPAAFPLKKHGERTPFRLATPAWKTQ